MAPNVLNELLRGGIAHHQAGRLGEAEGVYRRILAEEPRHADALHLLGVLRGQAGRVAEAVELIRAGIAASPAAPAGWWSNLGKFLLESGDGAGAVEACRRAVELRGDSVEGHVNLANAFRACGELAAAVGEYRYALRLRPELAGGREMLGAALMQLGGEANLREAVGLVPGSAAGWNNLGNVLQRSGRVDEAAGCYREALRIEPGLAEGHNNLGSVLKEMGEVAAAVGEYRRAVELKPGSAAMHSNLLLALNYEFGATRESLFREAVNWAERHADGLGGAGVGVSGKSGEPGRLRIGYVSADFRSHASAFFLVPLLENHDPEVVEVFCYSDVARPDDVTARLRRSPQGWRDIAGVSDERVAAMIREDGIDILVDLKLHADQNRLLVFARKPAPVQVTWLGYPGTTGMKAMDFRLSDPWLDPSAGDEAFYVEKTVRLPETFWCYDPMAAVAVQPLRALAAGRVTFGCLNHFSKIGGGEMMEIWSRVLHRVAGSRLMLLAHEGSHRVRTWEMFERMGIGRERVEFVTPRAREEYLRLYQQVDIGLDCWPVNGHTTTFDALWMGVPVVTMAGPTALGRAGVSQLKNVGLDELIGGSAEEYVEIAVRLAGDLKRLGGLRAELRGRMEKSMLMDGKRFARAMEQAFQRMWRERSGP